MVITLVWSMPLYVNRMSRDWGFRVRLDMYSVVRHWQYLDVPPLIQWQAHEPGVVTKARQSKPETQGLPGVAMSARLIPACRDAMVGVRSDGEEV